MPRPRHTKLHNINFPAHRINTFFFFFSFTYHTTVTPHILTLSLPQLLFLSSYNINTFILLHLIVKRPLSDSKISHLNFFLYNHKIGIKFGSAFSATYPKILTVRSELFKTSSPASPLDHNPPVKVTYPPWVRALERLRNRFPLHP